MKNTISLLKKAAVIATFVFIGNINAQSKFSFDSATVKTTHENLKMLTETVNGVTVSTRVDNANVNEVQKDNVLKAIETDFVSLAFNTMVNVKSIQILNKTGLSDIQIVPIMGDNSPVSAVVSEELSTVDLDWNNVVAISIIGTEGTNLNLEIDNIVFTTTEGTLSLGGSEVVSLAIN